MSRLQSPNIRVLGTRQAVLTLAPQPRGIHLITSQIQHALQAISTPETSGLLHLFVQHTSAALTINENADPSVRVDLEGWLNRTVQDADPAFTHTMEGPDDMSAHIKTLLADTALTIPVSKGAMLLGTWQGICLCEYRDHASARSLICTVIETPSPQ